MSPRLAHAQWPDVASSGSGWLVVPLGSLEQHGPHLPLATDTIIAESVCEAMLAQRPLDVVLAPTLPLGASGEHADFPGTVSIGTKALALLLTEIVRDAADTWAGVLVVNGHGGNAVALAQARAVCLAEGRALQVHHLAAEGMDAHAGQAETSLLLHLAPDLVDMAVAQVGVTTALSLILPQLRRDGVRAVSPTGVLGDPTGATAEQGRHLFDALVSAAVRTVDALAGGRGA